MKNLLLLALLWCMLHPGIPVWAAEQAEKSPLDWELSVRPKPTAEELERQRWSGVFANDIGLYLFDNQSLHVDETDKNLVHVLVRTIFADPKIIDKLNERYKEKLGKDDKVAASEMEMVFQLKAKRYAVTATKVVSERGIVLEDTKKTASFVAVTPKTFAESMYYIAQNYDRNQ
ncbi:hypothetical protein [Sporomusa acidovorans]|uniref:Uncharacterized protein n=1 Tax=Sporomusa acidovorans (strain ATCC 49682 / DSM 3132 / Mol) TaxID=1123286 RepID=A0ABZ3IY48_SPOA4|nr:hypothetical protein [Sporomusa acidovorans]OZC17669.1 hypothetical protein SPACI_36730 [Sporomusa acidovorans DSM 3132]SDE11593.1 hypothetical protein SAMN04488499_100848 [Sporomusa acidovorans]